MKRYKLIKKLPFEGSPEVGYISTPHWNGRGSLHYWNHNWFNPKDYPEYWEEMIEKDYEVLSLEYSGGIYYNSTTPDPTYGGYFKYMDSTGGWVSIMSVIKPTLPFDTQVKIHSIKRLSDGEVFIVGDNTNEGIIKDFQLCKDDRIIISFIDGLPRYLDAKGSTHVLKVKKPLFTTEDGKEIFEGDEFYMPVIPFNDKNKINICRQNATDYYEGYNESLTFSTKEAAEEYILMNKPCLSINDIITNYKLPEDGGYYYDCNIKGLKELVKSKL